jgi:hypothetical protein
MGKEGKAYFNDVSIFSLYQPILLMSKWAWHVVSKSYFLKKGV